MSPESLTLADATRALVAHGTSPTYNQLWNAVVAGRVPAERIGRRWMIRAADLEIVAQAFTDA